MDNVDRISRFKNNPQNANFFNHGNENISINGDRNTVIKTTNIYNNTTTKNPTKFIPNYDIHISSEQAHEIQRLISEIVDKEVIGGMDKDKAYGKWGTQLRNYMKVNSYLAIKIEDYEKAIKYLSKQNALKRSKLRRKDNDSWRKDIYKSIYSRASQLAISSDEVKNIANKRYEKNISSLKELGERELDDLRKYIFNIKG